MKINEVIVVEGIHDSDKLKRYFTCDTIETNGTHLSKKTLKLIEIINKQRGIIIFTDPDAPGEKIRQIINEHIPGCKNAFIDKSKAKTSKKVGIEHATKKDLEDSLSHLFTYRKSFDVTLTWEDYYDLGLNGKVDSAKKREELGKILFLGKANAKTLYKRLNMLSLTKKDVLEILLQQNHTGKEKDCG